MTEWYSDAGEGSLSLEQGLLVYLDVTRLECLLYLSIPRLVLMPPGFFLPFGFGGSGSKGASSCNAVTAASWRAPVCLRGWFPAADIAALLR